jgi:hypothetical protein
VEFIFASPLGDMDERELFDFFDEIASLPKTQVFVDTFKDLYIGKVPKGLLLKSMAEVDESNGWLKIRKAVTAQHLYPSVYTYSVTIVTFNVPVVSSKLHEYLYFKLKRGKVLLKKDKKEIVLVPYEKPISQDELNIITH